MSPPAALALLVLAPLVLAPLALAAAHASVEDPRGLLTHTARDKVKYNKVSRKVELPPGCLYSGRWHPEGTVPTQDACLVCMCGHGALICRHRACALPQVPPSCRLEHRRGECCPELHCPDGVKKLDQSASSRLDDLAIPESIAHACVEGGAVYAAGSAMSSNIACEQCFCLGGARRCVRPQCLPTPDACQAQPTPGACCPQRYYCQRPQITTASYVKNPHDCQTEDGGWVPEGEKVTSAAPVKECSECFCLGGTIICQSLSCAPKLKGCTPLVLPGQCCPHKYVCDDRDNGTIRSNLYSEQDNLLVSLNENRSFHSSKSAKRETTVKATSAPPSRKPSSAKTTKLPPSLKTTKVSPSPNTTKVPPSPKTTKETTTTRSPIKTDDVNTKADVVNSQPVNETKEDEKLNITTTTSTQTPEIEEFRTTKMSSTVTEESTTADSSTESTSTEQPESTIKIIINGTVNCTTELSSSTLVLNTSNPNESVWISSDIHPRIPFADKDEIEAHTSVPNEIITNRVYDEEFDDSDSFTINVTSSLRTNTSSPVHTSTTTTTPRPKTVPPILVDGINASKSKKDELDYDYNEPTLPPSLPNLKIIPFVAADAVVDEEILPKDNPTFTSLEHEDKFPVYYPGLETKEHAYPIRREDDYSPVQYPIYVTKKDENLNYITLTENSPNLNLENVNTTNVLSEESHKFTVGASIGNKIETHVPEASIVNSGIPISNLFSPPAETEGGFIPKSPGAIDEFYSIYSSTPPGPAVPLLTSSMQLETKEECIGSDGRRIADGESVHMGCSLCICAWNELHCSPRPCHSPPGCRWRPATMHSLDLCCGELICDYESSSTIVPMVTTTERIQTNKSSQITNENVEKDIVTNGNTLSNYTENVLQKEFEKELYGGKDSLVGNDTQGSAEAPTVQPTASTTNVGTAAPKPPLITEGTSNTNNQSLEYEEDDDEEFSLGSVLKLLLSENYDTKTTASPISTTKKTSTRTTDQKLNSPKIETSTTSLYEANEFIPMPPSVIPFKKLPSSNAITRIDHLVLGESNSIRESSSRPPTTPRSTLATRRRSIKTTQKPYTSKPTTKKDITTESNAIQSAGTTQPPPQPSGFGLGLPKLAGCNIYGQMYRVGRIITELSTPCQECRCTEFGVHCTSLGC